MPRPLEHITVVDLTRALAGPYATVMLAGLGARVIKVEDPNGGDLARHNAPYLGPDGPTLSPSDSGHRSLPMLNRSRGKLGVTLDLKHERAAGVFADLVRSADVVVENFSAGTADRLGVGYATSAAANPRVIYCSMSGFGADQYLGRPAMDTLIQALSGAMMVSGATDEPPVRIGLPIGDLMTPMFALVGILAALVHRDRTDVGQHVDISMLGVLTSVLAVEDWAALETLGLPTRTGNTMPRLAPFGIYTCRDGSIALFAVHDPLAHALFRAIARPELATSPDFATRDARVANHHELDAAISAWSTSRSLAEASAALESAGIPFAPVRKPAEALADPVVREREEVVPVRHPGGDESGLYTFGLPISFSESPARLDGPAPELGEHNDLVYRGLLGYSPREIAALTASGAI